MYYLYVLKSELDKKLYIGSTNNLKKRLQEHLDGKARSTKYRMPLRLVYYEAYAAEKDARIREQKLKNFKNAYARLKERITNSFEAT